MYGTGIIDCIFFYVQNMCNERPDELSLNHPPRLPPPQTISKNVKREPWDFSLILILYKPYIVVRHTGNNKGLCCPEYFCNKLCIIAVFTIETPPHILYLPSWTWCLHSSVHSIRKIHFSWKTKISENLELVHSLYSIFAWKKRSILERMVHWIKCLILFSKDRFSFPITFRNNSDWSKIRLFIHILSPLQCVTRKGFSW